jgi:two-component system cell cycle sensor histidine kinase PleC
MTGAGQARTNGDAARAQEKRAQLRRVQIDLNFQSVNKNSFSLPIWATMLNLFFAGGVPEVGVTPISTSWIWVAACLTGSIVAVFLKRRFREESAKGDIDLDKWYLRVLCLHLGIGISWSLSVWVHWDPANPANHMFLFVIAIGCAALYGVVRAGDFNIPIVGTLPLFLSLEVHFLQQALWMDTIMMLVLPVWYLQFLRDARNGSRVIENSHKTQIDLEQLAADLARARDDAETQRVAALHANASKSAFIANMSHELRTPLNAILGFSEIIAAQALGPEAQNRYREYAADIGASGRHLLSLINDMLDIAKIEAGKLELACDWLDGQALTAQGLHFMEERVAGRRVTLRVGSETAGARLFADERAFKQIALNLLSNAAKFTEEGMITATLKPSSAGVTFIVEDTGCGIPKDHIARIFQPFEQVDNRYSRANGGTGLGLTLVRALAELHGGSCKIESEEGKGTRVEVFLPYPSADVSQGATKAA